MSNGMTDQALRQKLKDCEAKLGSSESHYAALAPELQEQRQTITLALAVALILSVTGCQDRPGGFAVTDPSADPAFESDGFQRMVEVIGPTWPGFVERHGQPPADPSTPWLIPPFG